MRKKIAIAIVFVLLIFSGCSNRCNSKTCVPTGLGEPEKIIVKAKEMRISPIVGTRSEESRIVRDFGVIQKAWIAPYVNEDRDLISAHDIYVVISEPKWIPGQEIPKNSSGMKTPIGGVPFMFKNEEVYSSSDLSNDETIKKFVSEVYKKDKNSSLTDRQIDELKKFDESIKKFIKE